MDVARILCPLDLGEASEGLVFKYALDLAERLDASLHVLHVMEVPESDNPVVVNLAFERCEEQMKALDKKAKARSVELTTVTKTGIPHRAIMAEVEAKDIDLLIVGTHARSGVPRVLLGSVAESVLRSARVPVITLPYRKGAFAGPSSLVVGHDFSQGSHRALSLARGLSDALKAPVSVVHVASPDKPVAPEVAPRLAEEVGNVFGAEADGVSTRVDRGALPDRLNEICVALGVDLVVVGATGRGAIERFFLGSTASKLVRTSEVPVLTVP